MTEVKIHFDPVSRWYVVTYFNGTHRSRFNYGSYATLIGALTDNLKALELGLSHVKENMVTK